MENRIVALEKTAERHEAVIEMLRHQLDQIGSSVIRIEQRLSDRPLPGETAFCKSHLTHIDLLLTRMDKLEVDMTEMRKLLYKGVGGLIAVVFIVNVTVAALKWLL